MKKKKHLETKFLKFLLERQKQLEDGDVNVPLTDDGEDLPPVRKTLRMKPMEVQMEEEEEEDEIDGDDLDIEDECSNDEEILEKLTLKYKKIKNEYENKLRNRKRR
jgi:hypothetical protein